MVRNFRNFILACACFGIGATAALAQPAVSGVKPTADGYEISGKGFGRDKAKVQVFEGMTQVPPMGIVSVAENLIVVRSKPSGMVQHRVVVGGQSATLGFMHSPMKMGAPAKPATGVIPGMAASAKSMARPPAVPALTQTLTTATASMTGNRGQKATAPPPPVPSLTQTLTTAAASMTGNRGQAAAAPPPPIPSLTQTLTTPAASMTGNR